MTGEKSGAVARISEYFQTGVFKADLGVLVAYPTESQTGAAGDILHSYLEDGIALVAGNVLDFKSGETVWYRATLPEGVQLRVIIIRKPRLA